jgi:hypothetical protein
MSLIVAKAPGPMAQSHPQLVLDAIRDDDLNHLASFWFHGRVRWSRMAK